MFWENFVLLCNKKGITPNGVCSELNLSNAVATKWKNGAVPRSTTLHKIAEYFDVSISDLIDPPIKKIAKSSGPILSPIPEDAPTEFTTMEIDRSEVEKRFALQNKKPADEGELREDVVIYHRDGKTVKRTFTKEQLALFHAMLDAIPEDPNDNKGL